MKKILGILIVFVLLGAAGVVLVTTGVIKLPGSASKNDNTAAAYIEIEGAFYIIGADGTIREQIETSSKVLPKITGIEFKFTEDGKELENDNGDDFKYALLIARNITKYKLKDVKEINISDEGEATVFARNIQILLGQNNRTDEKLSELKDFYSQVIEMNGVLDMKKIDDNGLGFTFKNNE